MALTTTQDLQARVRRWREKTEAAAPAPTAMERLEERVARLEPLEDEVTRLRAANFELAAAARAGADRRSDRGDRAMSRGQFLRFGGAAAAGAVAAGASGLLSAGPAAAATGQPVVLGVSNSATATTETTSVVNPSTGQLSTTVLRVNNVSNAAPPVPSARVALAAVTSGVDTTGLPRIGVWAETDQLSKSIAVVGRSGAAGVDPLAATASLTTGVLGTAVDGGTGAVGAANGTSAWGIQGRTNAGVGVVGTSDTGISIWAGGGGRLLQTVRPAGAPTTGAFLKGEQIRDANGELWVCVADGSPGTWRRVATVKEGFAGGSVNLLPRPIRLLDTRSGPPLAAGASLDLQVTGSVINGVSVPAGAVAVIGNVTVTQTAPPGGYVTLYAQGSPPNPATSNVNWFAANQDLSASAIAALNTANGKLTIHNGIGGGSSATHVVFDAAGFVF